MLWQELLAHEHYRLRRVTDAAVEPVSVAEAKQQANYEDDDQDQNFAVFVKAAREMYERDTQRALLTQSWQLSLDCFPDDVIELRRCPVSAVTSITYLDDAGASQTLSTDIYQVDVHNEPARITRKYNKTWPSTYPQAGAVTVSFTVGYGSTVESVPATAKMAIRLLAAHWFNNREAVGNFGDIAMLSYGSLVDSLRWSGYR